MNYRVIARKLFKSFLKFKGRQSRTPVSYLGLFTKVSYYKEKHRKINIRFRIVISFRDGRVESEQKKQECWKGQTENF